MEVFEQQLKSRLKEIDKAVQSYEGERRLIVQLLEKTASQSDTKTGEVKRSSVNHGDGKKSWPARIAAGTPPLSSVDMAKAVLDEGKKELAPREIRAAIRQRFGVEPAPTLEHMIYKRVADKKAFYKGESGYGLMSWKAKRKVASAPSRRTKKAS